MKKALRNWWIVVVGVAFLVAASAAGAQRGLFPEYRRDTEHFKSLLAEIRKGDSADRVRQLLGSPYMGEAEMALEAEWLRTPKDAAWTFTCLDAKPGVIWAIFWFDKSARVVSMWRTDVPSTMDDQLSSTEQVTAARVLDKATRLDGDKFDPLATIRTVNTLTGLGKRKALAALWRFVQEPDNRNSRDEGVFLILRVLFEIPEVGYMPAMHLGAPTLTEPKNATVAPRFPIVIQDDVPLMLVYGYSGGGAPQVVQDHLAYFGRFGAIRPRPLRPPDNPLPVLERLERSRKAFWLKEYAPRYGSFPLISASQISNPRSMLREQLLKTIDPIYHVDGLEGYRLPFPEEEEQKRWREIELEVARRKPRWDAQQQTYVSTVGTKRTTGQTPATSRKQ